MTVLAKKLNGMLEGVVSKSAHSDDRVAWMLLIETFYVIRLSKPLSGANS
jgi:hypothetical protein